MKDDQHDGGVMNRCRRIKNNIAIHQIVRTFFYRQDFCNHFRFELIYAHIVATEDTGTKIPHETS